MRAKYCLNKRTWNFSKNSYDLGADLYLREVVTNNNYFCGFLKFQNQWTCTAQWAKKGLSQKMTKQIKSRYCYDFEMFTKWNHTTIPKIWIQYILKIEEINYNPCNESKRLYNYCKRRNASGLLITCYDYIGVEKFAARWSATKCEISTLNSPSCCHQLVQQLIIIG